MRTKRNYYIYGTITIALVAVIVMITAYFTIPRQESTISMTNMPGMSNNGGESAMYKKYAAIKGEAYDKIFLADMVVHHESALNMAEKAEASAQHQEIKDLAANINSTQGPEVAKMNALQGQWGYQKTSGHMMSGGDRSAMMDMSMEGDELKGLSGDAFDKKFLEVMIKHHQAAVDMSEPAAMNASRQEIKDLAQGIITAQTKEITQMQIWQKQWGYLNV